MTRVRQVFRFGVLIFAALVILVGWMVGEFAIAPMHCSGDICGWWALFLRISVIGSLVGVSCLALSAMDARPGTLLPLGTGILAFLAVAGLMNPAMFLISIVDFVLAAGVVVWFMIGWLD